ncbi:histidine kinase 4-like [Senna tora]|uniref:histidine kinase n=1 Tax=Senna tora TaxID=362788 RepID=A0A834SPT9_9FABA|nr:histidine kinase 4-like [Senna tora]
MLAGEIKLAVFVSDKVPDIVMGDPGRFRQIITNLVGNSVKFTEQGHIFVKVHLAENINTTMNGKSETYLNGGSDDVVHSQFKTLSGCEAADERNSWDNFKHLIADEEFCLKK